MTEDLGTEERALASGSRPPRCPPPARPGTPPAQKPKEDATVSDTSRVCLCAAEAGEEERYARRHRVSWERASTASARAMKLSTSLGSYSTSTWWADATPGGEATARTGVAPQCAACCLASKAHHFGRRRVELGPASEAPDVGQAGAGKQVPGPLGGVQESCSSGWQRRRVAPPLQRLAHSAAVCRLAQCWRATAAQRSGGAARREGRERADSAHGSWEG